MRKLAGVLPAESGARVEGHWSVNLMGVTMSAAP